MPLVDDTTLTVDVPPDCGDDDMATVDLPDNSYAHWKERLYHLAEMTRESHHFWTDQSRSQHLEGKMGMRESIAMQNMPPALRALLASGQGP